MTAADPAAPSGAPPAPVAAGLLSGLDGSSTPAAGSAVRLHGSRCGRCGRADFPQRASCPVCGGGQDPLLLGPAGRLAGFTEVLHQPPGALVRAPYAVGVALFADGIAVTGLLRDAPSPRLGDAVETVAAVLEDGRVTFAFRPAGGG